MNAHKILMRFLSLSLVFTSFVFESKTEASTLRVINKTNDSFKSQKKQEIKKQVTIGTLLGLSLFIYGCNTMEGVGTDVKKAGESIERSAERHKNPPVCPTCSRPVHP